MCGIAGMFCASHSQFTSEESEVRLTKMASAMRHRGPDDTGIETVPGGGLGFVRLSIIDLEGGHQPMSSVSGRFTIVFNGEIYNYRELRAELVRSGRTFATQSDTEVLLTMFETYGPSMLDQLNGMFAFAIHDRDSGTVFAARDRMGIKPFFYALASNTLVFASELDALMASNCVPAEMDPQAFADYLCFGFVCAPRTIYCGVHALEPGHCLEFSAGEVTVRRYWRVERSTTTATTMDDALEQLEPLLDSAARMQLVADVPLGTLLSGGIDSGLITALLARATDEPLRTFSVGFEEDDFNELPWARRVAEMYGTKHTEIVCRPDARALVEKLAFAYGQPFGDSSALPSYIVSEEARRHVTVALSGDGGDEVFAGYGRHTRLFDVPSTSGRRVAGAAHGLLSRLLAPDVRGMSRLRRAGLSERDRQGDALVVLSDEYREWLGGPLLSDHLDRSGLQITRAAGGVFEAEGGVRRFQHQDLSVYLPNDILEKMDRASMLNSLEVRVPLLDHRVVEFGLNLPPELKSDGTHGKLILRALANRLLPPGHLNKPKSGFAIPRDRWLRMELREMVEDHLHRSRLGADGWLNQARLSRLVHAHMGGRQLGNALWLLLMAEFWYRRFAEGTLRRVA